MTASAPFLSTVTPRSWPSSSTAQKRLWGERVTQSTACLLFANRAVAAGAALLLELAFFRFATRPGARQAPGDARGLDDVHQACAPASRMEREACLEVARAAEGVARVFVARVEMEQIDQTFSCGRPAEDGRLPGVRVIYSPLQ